jgi:DNA-binding beta-propeller fold protein YncE
MSYPYDVKVDGQGFQFVCEFGNSRIQVFDPRGQPVEILGGPGAAPGQFSNPWGLALDSKGNLYVADAMNHRVQKFIRRDAMRAQSKAAVRYVFSVPAAPVAQTCSLLYRRFLTCLMSPASNVLPITNRRYGRLQICATLNWDEGRGEAEPGLASPTVQSESVASGFRSTGREPGVADHGPVE